MRKWTLVALACCFFVINKAAADCLAYAHVINKRVARDTTFITYLADTGTSTTGYTYTWSFSDGTTRTGAVIVYPATSPDPGTVHYTLTVSDGAGCSDTWFDDVNCDFVFNCSRLSQLFWDISTLEQVNLSNPSSVVLSLGSNAYESHPQLLTHMDLDWGNGHIAHTITAADTTYIIRGDATSSYASHYHYAGEYTIRASYFVSLDTMTCPVADVPAIAIHLGGPVPAPLITGGGTYCAGDTVRLMAFDTTFTHNMYRYADTTGTGDRHYFPWFTDLGPVDPTSITCRWYDHNSNLVSTDTSVIFNNLTLTDTGLYTLVLRDTISNQTGSYTVHITASGSSLTVDSVVHPVCTSAGVIALNCYRANDSVTVTYSHDGLAGSFSGRTTANGRLNIIGLSAGLYSGIRAHFIGDVCGSNFVDPVLLQGLPTPVIQDSAVAVCIGSSVTLHASSTDPGLSFLWSGPGGYSSTSQNPVLTGVTSSGTYSVILTSGSCVSSVPGIVHLAAHLPLSPVIAAGLADTICPGGHTDAVSGTVWGSWSSGNTTVATVWSGYNGVQYVMSIRGVNSGTAVITYTETNACGSAYVTHPIVVKNASLPPITGPDYLCAGAGAMYSCATPGGTWSVDSYTGATINPVSGYFSFGSSSSGVSIAYTANVSGCIISAIKPIVYSGSGTIRYITAKSCYPGDTITFDYPISPVFTASTWTSSADSVVVVADTTMVAGVNGRTVLTKTLTTACGTETWNWPVFVTDRIDTRVGGVPYPFYPNGDRSGESNVPAKSTYISRPTCSTFDKWGNLYVWQGNGVIRKINRVGIITDIAGREHKFGYSGDGGPALFARLSSQITDMKCDKWGDLVIVDHGNSIIRKIDKNGIITTIAGKANMPDTTGAGGPATAATLYYPNSISIDTANNIYFTDNTNSIRKIGSSGTMGPIIIGPLYTGIYTEIPLGLAADTSGGLFFSTTLGYLRHIQTDGTGLSTVLYPYYPFSGLPSIWGNIDIDKRQNVYYTESNIVCMLTPGGVIRTIVGGSHSANSLSANVLYNSSDLSDRYPIIQNGYYFSGIRDFAVDDSGAVYINNGYDNTIRKEGIPSISISRSADSVCQGTSVIFTAGGHNHGNQPYYEWKKNSAPVGDGSATYITNSLATGDTISCTLYNMYGDKKIALSNAFYMVIKDSANAGTITGTNTLCAGVSATLTDTVAGGTWSSSSTSVSVSGGVVTAATAGSATISYSVSNSCGSATDTMEIIINSMPDAGSISAIDSICEGSELLLTSSAPGGAWSSSNTAIITVTAAGMITATAPGTATLSYAVANSCGTATATHTMRVIPMADCNPSGVGTTTTPSVAIYPNPTTGSFTVALARPDADAVITVSDLSGRVMKEVSPSGNATQIFVSIGNLASGTYMVKITTGGVVYNHKIVLW